MADAIITVEPNGAAADWLRTKARTNARVFGALKPEIRARAFAVAGIEDMERLRRVQEAIAEIPEGGSWKDAKEAVAKALGGRAEAADRAERVVRDNAFQAYAAARYRSQMEDRDVFPYLKYVTVGDGRVRDSHAKLDGVILPKGDPFWEDHYPPWDFGCRCVAVELTEAMAEEQRKSGDGRMADAAWSEDWRAAHAGQDAARGYHNRPGQLTMALDEVAFRPDGAPRYSEEDLRDFNAKMEHATVERTLEDGSTETLTVREWMWEPVREKHEKRLLEAGKDGKEHVVVLDRDTGRELKVSVRESGADEVKFRIEYGDSQTVAVYHNHPGGEPDLSPADVAVLFDRRVGEVGSTTFWLGSRRVSGWHGNAILEEKVRKLATAARAARDARDWKALAAAENEWKKLYKTITGTGVLTQRRED